MSFDQIRKAVAAGAGVLASVVALYVSAGLLSGTAQAIVTTSVAAIGVIATALATYQIPNEPTQAQVDDVVARLDVADMPDHGGPDDL